MSDSNSNWLALKKRYVGLDIFRILCVIGVCAFHTVCHLGANYGIFQGISTMGAVFMTAFFLLSGYSLFVNYSYKNIIDFKNLKNFLLKRFIGIVPMYYVAGAFYIVFCYGAYRLLGQNEYSLLDEAFLAPAELLLIQANFHTVASYTHNAGTWFISCILMCYLVYPLIQEVSKQLSNKAKIIIIALFCFILLYSPFIQMRFQTITLYTNPFFRILEFSIGILLASMKPELDKKIFVKKYVYNWITILAVNVVMIIGVTIAVNLDISIGNAMLYSWACLPCFIVMLLGFSGIESEKLQKSKVIQYCSSISYVFFLAQLISNKICQLLLVPLNISSNIHKILLGWGVCIVIALIYHEVFEKPIKKVLTKKRLLA